MQPQVQCSGNILSLISYPPLSPQRQVHGIPCPPRLQRLAWHGSLRCNLSWCTCLSADSVQSECIGVILLMFSCNGVDLYGYNSNSIIRGALVLCTGKVGPAKVNDSRDLVIVVLDWLSTLTAFWSQTHHWSALGVLTRCLGRSLCWYPSFKWELLKPWP